MVNGRRICLVLGAGGMKGLAHIGVLKVLEKAGIVPDEYVGTSVGAFISAMAAGGRKPHEIEDIALSITRKDIVDYDWRGLLWRRSHAHSLYRGKAFHDFVRRSLLVDDFSKLSAPLFMTSVDLTLGREIVWGTPGFTEIPIHDCVVASCSIPGIFPPKRINRYYFVDGGLVDPLPLKVAISNHADLIIAVYLQSSDEALHRDIADAGFAGILAQSETILSRTLMRHNLNRLTGAPVVLIEPHVGNHGLFEFENTAEVIQEGARATLETLSSNEMIREMLKPEPHSPPSAAVA